MQKSKVLLINDATQLFRMMGCLFDSRGCQAVVVDEVGDAFEKLSAQHFDLVIIKFNESRVRYLPILQIIKDLSPETGLVLIGEDAQFLEDVCQGGLGDFIVLPCRFAELWRQISDYLEASISARVPAREQDKIIRKQVLSKLGQTFYGVRRSLLSIAGGINVLGQGATAAPGDVFEAIFQDTHKKLSKLVSATEEVINGFLLLEELSEKQSSNG